MGDLPTQYDPAAAEARWRTFWEERGLYRWDETRPREETFVVDTPPPTVSGSLHIGHVFSYTHQDLLARYRRMQGDNIFYGMGWDDNGLPTERRVRNVFGIKCDPSVPYDPGWKPRRDKGKKDPVEQVSRQNFIEACLELTVEDEAAFETLWRRVGLSVDWSRTYATIDPHSRRIAQWSFLELLKKGQAEHREAPTMWDTDFGTAVAQAEVEDRPRDGLMYDLRFAVEGGGEFTISTTRPELLPACIAVVAHPDDERYKPLFGQRAITPLFSAPVPILPADHADPEKGSGILMVCTFGDVHDVDWWKASGLPLKAIIGMAGKLLPVEWGEGAFESVDPTSAQAAYDPLAGLYVNQARRAIVAALEAEGTGPHGEGAARVGEPVRVKQAVKYYEKGDRPLEFVPTRQWFVKLLDHKAALLEQGRRIQWHPAHMRTRYDHWVEGLNQDWCVSRQRYFGVPIPVWYPIEADGRVAYERPIAPAEASLPVDPMADTPPGYAPSQRDQPLGYTGDPDVFDTWATSALTPQIQSHGPLDAERHGRLYPMDIRPQAHEIIRTWAFYTIVKSWMHTGEIPWKHVVISGWILDPDRKKMSKSRGNVVTPMDLLDQHSVDAVRYWAGRARMGADTTFDPKVFKLGGRLARKIFNACRFVFQQCDRALGDAPPPGPEAITHPVDVAFVARLRAVITQATEAFDGFEPAAALQATEEAFWGFCDDYLELVKGRSYSEEDTPERASAIATLHVSISAFLRLLAPFMPYITEEVFSWRMASEAQPSVHTAPWPSAVDFAGVGEGFSTRYEVACAVLGQVRQAKSRAKKSVRWPMARLTICGAEAELAALESALPDLQRAGNVPEAAVVLTVQPGAEAISVEVELEPEAD